VGSSYARTYAAPTDGLLVQGKVAIGTAATTALAALTVQSIATENPTFYFNDVDVTPPSYSSIFGGVSALNTNTIGAIAPYSGVSTGGGIAFNAFTGSGVNNGTPFALVGYHGGTSPTTAAINLVGYKWNGATSRTGLSGSELILQISGGIGTPVMTVQGNGNTFIGGSTTTPTARLQLAAGTATASTAPLKLTSGTNLTTAEAGAMEYNGTNLFFSPSTTRYTVDLSLTGSATLDFGSTAAGGVTDLTITVTGAADGDVVSLGVPNGSMPVSGSFSAWVSATNTVSVRYANNDLTNARDPASGTFKVRVIK